MRRVDNKVQGLQPLKQLACCMHPPILNAHMAFYPKYFHVLGTWEMGAPIL